LLKVSLLKIDSLPEDSQILMQEKKGNSNISDFLLCCVCHVQVDFIPWTHATCSDVKANEGENKKLGGEEVNLGQTIVIRCVHTCTQRF